MGNNYTITSERLTEILQFTFELQYYVPSIKIPILFSYAAEEVF